MATTLTYSYLDSLALRQKTNTNICYIFLDLGTRERLPRMSMASWYFPN
jgi:hypothetical protein